MSEKLTEQNQLQNLLMAYGESEPIQGYENSSTDNQLNSISIKLQEIINKTRTGTVLDIGCGKGILLSKLAEINSFIDNREWLYIGADFNNLDDILKLAVKLKVHRRCDTIHLDKFYSSWLESVDATEPLLVFLRNVLHELDILMTAKLLLLLLEHMKEEDTLLIQDLLVFPQAERGNVCWDSECLGKVLDQLGFEHNPAISKTKSGAQWISILVQKKANVKLLSLSEVTCIVAKGRMEQLEKWRALKNFPSDIRNSNIAKIDFDLQLSALYLQLDDAGYLNAQQQQEAPSPDPQRAFQLALSKYDPSVLERNRFRLLSLHNFRDRANSQDALEQFLTAKDAVVVISGGAACGKTALVSHVLSRRAHERSVVPIDCASTNDVWSILEQYLLAIECPSSFEILSHNKGLQFKQLEEIVSELMMLVSEKTIVVFDHFENLLDPNGEVMNAEVRNFLTLIASSNYAKLILTTRRLPVLDFFPESVAVACEQPPVGRFPQGPYVHNILDDYVDRAAIGLEEYPAELLNAIDRFPYLATLAGKLIAEVGISVAQDPIILKIIRSYLYDELVEKIATPIAKNALDLARVLRIPSPIALYENIVGKEATAAALETGILFNVPDRYRCDLLSCAAILRDTEAPIESSEGDADSESAQKERHTKIAKNYETLSHGALGDPRWIREAHYHYFASGDLSELHKVGCMYKDELFWAGQVLFRKYHSYDEALEMLQAAEAMGFVTYESRRLIASCLIRTGDRKLGTSYYDELISDYPDYLGAKTSYVDSLLNIKEHSDALNLLEEFGFTKDNATAWVLGQFGRSYLGLGEYLNAAFSFELQLKQDTNSPPIAYVRLAQSYFRNGDREGAQKAIQRGLTKHKGDSILNCLYYSNLIKDNTKESLNKASEELYKLLDSSPRNGYVLQKLVKVSSLQDDLPRVLAHLEKIHWQVTPSYLEIPIRISISLSQKNFKNALEMANQISNSVEYAIPTLYSIYLSWAYAEKNKKTRTSIAAHALTQEIPPNLQKNIPVLTMRAQLARFAGNNELFEQAVIFINNYNPTIATQLRNSEIVDPGDFEPEMP